MICVLHGNLSLDNVMEDGDRVIFTSWSRAALGSPLLDLELLLFSSCSRAMREENTAKLLETYYYSFCSAVKQMGSDPVTLAPTLNLKFLKEEFERFQHFLLIWFKTTSYVDKVDVSYSRVMSQEIFNTKSLLTI